MMPLRAAYSAIPGFSSNGVRSQTSTGVIGFSNKKTSNFAQTLRNKFRFSKNKGNYARLNSDEPQVPPPPSRSRPVPRGSVPSPLSGARLEERKATYQHDVQGEKLRAELRELNKRVGVSAQGRRPGTDTKGHEQATEPTQAERVALARKALQHEFSVLNPSSAHYDEDTLGRLATKLAALDSQLSRGAAPEYNMTLLLTTLAAQGRIREMFDATEQLSVFLPSRDDKKEVSSGIRRIDLLRKEAQSKPPSQRSLESACSGLEGLLDQMLGDLAEGHDGHDLCSLAGQSSILDGAIKNLREKAVMATIEGKPVSSPDVVPDDNVKSLVANEMATVTTRAHLQQALLHAKAPLLGGNLSAYRFDDAGVADLRRRLGNHAGKVDLLITRLHQLDTQRQSLPAVRQLREAIERRLDSLHEAARRDTLPPLESGFSDSDDGLMPKLTSDEKSATQQPKSSKRKEITERVNEIRSLTARREALLPKGLAKADHLLRQAFATDQPWTLYGDGKAHYDETDPLSREELKSRAVTYTEEGSEPESRPPLAIERKYPDSIRQSILVEAAKLVAVNHPLGDGDQKNRVERLLVNWDVEDSKGSGSADPEAEAPPAIPTPIDSKDVALFVPRGVSSSSDLASIQETLGYFRRHLKDYLTADRLKAAASKLRWKIGDDGPDPIRTMTAIVGSAKSEDKARLLGNKILQVFFQSTATDLVDQKHAPDSAVSVKPPTIDEVVKDNKQTSASIRSRVEAAFQVKTQTQEELLDKTRRLKAATTEDEREDLMNQRETILIGAGLKPEPRDLLEPGPDRIAQLTSLVHAAVIAELEGKQLVSFHPDKAAEKIVDRLRDWGVDVECFRPEIDAVLAQPMDDETLESWRVHSHVSDSAHLADRAPGTDAKGPRDTEFNKQKNDFIASIEQMGMTTRVRMTRNVRGEITTGRIPIAPDPTGALGISGKIGLGWQDSIEMCRVGEGYEISLRRNFEVRGGVEASAKLGGQIVLADAKVGLEGSRTGQRTVGVSLRFSNDKSGREGMQSVLRSLLNDEEPDLSKVKFIAPLREQVSSLKVGASASAALGFFQPDLIDNKAVSSRVGVGVRATAGLNGSRQMTTSSTYSTLGSVEKRERIIATEQTVSAGVTSAAILPADSGSLSGSDNVAEHTRTKTSHYRRQLKKVSGVYGETAPQTEYIQSLNLPERRRRAMVEETLGAPFQKLIANWKQSDSSDDKAMAALVNRMLDEPGPNEAFVVTSNIDPNRALEIDKLQLMARNLRAGMGGYTPREAAARADAAEARVRQILDDPHNYVIARIDLHGHVESSLSVSTPTPFLKVQYSQDTRGFYVSHQVKPDPSFARKARDQALGLVPDTKAPPAAVARTPERPDHKDRGTGLGDSTPSGIASPSASLSPSLVVSRGTPASRPAGASPGRVTGTNVQADADGLTPVRPESKYQYLREDHASQDPKPDMLDEKHRVIPPDSSPQSGIAPSSTSPVKSLTSSSPGTSQVRSSGVSVTSSPPTSEHQPLLPSTSGTSAQSTGQKERPLAIHRTGQSPSTGRAPTSRNSFGARMQLHFGNSPMKPSESPK